MPSMTKGRPALPILATSFESNLPDHLSTSPYGDFDPIPTSHGSLLLPQIPSPGLHLEEMIQSWQSIAEEKPPLALEKAVGSSLFPTSISGFASSAPLLGFSRGISAKKSSRSPSLLSPTPRILPGDDFPEDDFREDPSSFERRLPCTTPICANRWANGTYDRSEKDVASADPPSLQVEKSSIRIVSPSTPVPSLTQSGYSASSSTLDNLSAPNDQGSDNARSRRQPTSRLVLNTDVDAAMYKPPVIQIQPEVSYFDWDDVESDGQHSLSTLARLRGSLADLRAAGHFITDLRASSKTLPVRERLDHARKAKATKYSLARSTNGRHLPAKLRKHTSTRLPSSKYSERQSNHQSTSDSVHQERTSWGDVATLSPTSSSIDRQGGISTIVPVLSTPAIPQLRSKGDRPSVMARTHRLGGKKKIAGLSIVGNWARKVLVCKNDNMTEGQC